MLKHHATLSKRKLTINRLFRGGCTVIMMAQISNDDDDDDENDDDCDSSTSSLLEFAL